MEYLEILNRLWYLFLFPVVAFIVKEDKEVPILFSLMLAWNHIVFDVIGIPPTVWFLVQALFSILFWYGCKYISYLPLRKAARIVCLYVVFINLFEQFSLYQTIFYPWWEIINWVALDLIAACILLNNKVLRVGKSVQPN
jgi:hypothetical protein